MKNTNTRTPNKPGQGKGNGDKWWHIYKLAHEPGRETINKSGNQSNAADRNHTSLDGGQ